MPNVVQKNDYNMASIDLDELKEHIKSLDPHYKTLTIVPYLQFFTLLEQSN